MREGRATELTILRLGVGTWFSLWAHAIFLVVALVVSMWLPRRPPPPVVIAADSSVEILPLEAFEPPMLKIEPPEPPPPPPPPPPPTREARSAGPSEIVRPQVEALAPARGPRKGDQAARISKELAELDMQVLASLGRSDREGVVADVLSAGDSPIGLLDGVRGGVEGGVPGGTGVAMGTGELREGRGGGLAGLGGGAVRPGASGSAVAGVDAGAEKPEGRVRLAGTTLSGSLEAAAVSRALRGAVPRVRRCYEKGLTRDPKLGGRIALSIAIGPEGAVTSAADLGKPSDPGRDDEGTTLADASVVSCVVSAVRALRFPASDEEATRVEARFELSPR